MKKRDFLTGLGACAAALALTPAHAQAPAWPAKPVELVVPYPPGGNSDVLARSVAAELGTALGQTVVVVNKPGAAGAIGAAYVARAPSDGYTLLLGDIATHAINPIALPSLAYDPVGDFTPVARLTSVSLVLATNAETGFKDVGSFLTAVRAEPGRYSYASGGAGTPSHLAMEMLQSMTDTELLHVPYRGSAPAMTDVAAGQVQVLIDGAVMPMVKAGRLVPLAVTAGPSPALPEVPPLAEVGVPDYYFASWHGVFAPKGTDAAVVNQLAEALTKIAESPTMKSRFAELGIELTPAGPEAFGTFVAEQRGQLQSLVTERKLSFEQ